jgi:S1-C subfamily serine protease
MIQTNVRVSTTRSGSVLIDSSGAVIGLISRRGLPSTTPISDGRSGSMSKNTTLVPRYATPIEYAKQVADELILTGRVAHPWLGVESSDLSEEDAERYGRSGAHIDRITPGSPAENAGLQTNDVIVGINGDTAIGSGSDLVVALRRYKPAESVAITYLRGNEEQVAFATLAENGAVP